MLKVKPRNSLVPFILDVYEDSLPETAPRVVARCDSRDGNAWRTTSPLAPDVSWAQIRAALASYTLDA